MTRERKIEILMMGHCTKTDAIRHVNNGACIYTEEDFQGDIEDMMKNFYIGEEEAEDFKKMIYEKIPMEDWEIVKDEEHTYFIMYVL